VSVSEKIEFCGARKNAIAATLSRAVEPKLRGLLLLSSELLPAALTERLTSEGYDVLRLGELPEDDREALSDMDAACEWLKRERACEEVFAIGAGDGGTRVFLLACTTSALVGVVNLEGPVQLAELNREHPFQPLEMALSLSCPLLAFFGESNSAVPKEDQVRAAEVLSQFARTFDIVGRPGEGHDPLEKAEIDRILSFLTEASA